MFNLSVITKVLKYLLYSQIAAQV